MALSLNVAVRSEIVNALSAHLNAGRLRIYDGAAPADADTAIGAQTLLADVTLPADAFVENADGSISLNGSWADNDIDASGTAAWFRLLDSALGSVIQGTVGVGSGDLQVDDAAFVAGGVFTVTGFSFTMPAA